MIIGLIDIDGHNFPNLALMKISAYHKTIGDSVEWVNYFKDYDMVYQSKVFSYTPDNGFVVNARAILKGGTGYDPLISLPSEIEKTLPDYSIYPKTEHAYGFLTRGCPRKCKWCIVPIKEGDIRPESDIEEILQGRKSAILMDNNILACEYGINQIEKIIKLKIKVDFNQGLDARIIAKDTEIAKLLSKVKWLKPLRLACDNESMKEPLRRAVYLLRKFDCTPKQYFVYVLLNDLQDSHDRIMFCKNLKLKPFAQPYRNFTQNQKIPQWQIDMAHYTNKKSILYSIDFKDFRPRKGFKCSQYFRDK